MSVAVLTCVYHLLGVKAQRAWGRRTQDSVVPVPVEMGTLLYLLRFPLFPLGCPLWMGLTQPSKQENQETCKLNCETLQD